MEIKIATTLLASPNLALGRIGPSGLSLNGQQIVDEAEFFRAAVPTFFDRGSAGVTLTFAVERIFSTIRSAEAFLLQHAGAVPRSGLVTCVCGAAGDTQTVYLRNAVLEAVALPGYRGCSVGVQYTIRGAAFESDVPPEEIPGEPDEGEGEFIVLRRGKIPIAEAAETVDVAFSSPLSAVPTIARCAVSRPTGGQNIDAVLCEETITVNGFTVELTGPTPDATYVLHYVAIE